MGILTFGEKLKELRMRAGFTQDQLAVLMNVSTSAISFYELQERMPPTNAVIKAAAIFHVTTDYLLGMEEKERIDVSGLTDNDIMIVSMMIESLREKNKKIEKD